MSPLPGMRKAFCEGAHRAMLYPRDHDLGVHNKYTDFHLGVAWTTGFYWQSGWRPKKGRTTSVLVLQMRRSGLTIPMCYEWGASEGMISAVGAAALLYEHATTLGQKGGLARAAAMTPEQRSSWAKMAARVRWQKPVA